MKHFKNIDGNLKMTDSSSLMLAMPYIAVCFTAASLFLTLLSNRNQESDAFTIFTWSLLIFCILVICWALIKKTFTSQIPITAIIQMKQSSYNSSVFYLVLENGKQRNLSEVRETIRATELLMMLRSENPSITANFTENEAKTR
ncbi:hypothetical protein [Nonlabens agnitus]|uniref:hypothetical protein n=1 Tax=Nonlabens agnitus TaxID=870484 RepID=UPI0011B24E62|nr:hypothetical protein [Nonlabens agnitus]